MLTKKLGLIIEHHKREFIVETDDGIFPATIKGNLKKNDAFYTGDRVEIQILERDPPAAIVLSVQKRKNVFVRPPVANIDLFVVLCSINEPPLDLEIIDRLLFAASVLNVDTILGINKIDTHTPIEDQKTDQLAALYTAAGYTTCKLSAQTGEGTQTIAAACAGKISAFAGVSGVGKSSILSKIFPNRDFRTNVLSKAISRGTHTTTSTSLVKLPDGGYIADTPGFSRLDVPPVQQSEVARHFPEFAALDLTCKYDNCTHTTEPGCMVTQQVESGAIARSRYNHYVMFFDEMHARRRTFLYKHKGR